jgi:hypothetical protein
MSIFFEPGAAYSSSEVTMVNVGSYCSIYQKSSKLILGLKGSNSQIPFSSPYRLTGTGKHCDAHAFIRRRRDADQMKWPLLQVSSAAESEDHSYLLSHLCPHAIQQRR